MSTQSNEGLGPSRCSSIKNRRERIATAIVADIMRGYHGQASQLKLIVNGLDDGGWERGPLIIRIMTVLDEMDVA